MAKDLNDYSDEEFDQMKNAAIKAMGENLSDFIIENLILMVSPQKLMSSISADPNVSDGLQGISVVCQTFVALGVFTREDFTKQYLAKVMAMVAEKQLSNDAGVNSHIIGLIERAIKERLEYALFNSADNIPAQETRAAAGLRAITEQLNLMVTNWQEPRLRKIMREQLVTLKKTLPQPNGPITIDELIEII